MELGALRRASLGLVAVTLLLNLWVLWPETTAVDNFNDGVLHLSMIRWARHQIDHGSIPLDGWFPYLNLGASQFHHYQSLPHIVVAYVSLLVGPTTAYFWSIYLLLALWPLSVYAGARLLGWGAWTSAAAASVAPVLVSASGYGYEDSSYTWSGLGAWTQLWGMWLLPLSWGLTWRAVMGNGSLALGALAVALTTACHFLTAYLALLALGVWILAAPRGLLFRAGRAAVVGIGGLLIAAWVIVPAFADSRWFPSSEYVQGTFWYDSFGAPRVLGWLFTGQLYDSGRFPVVSLLVAVGLLVCLVRFKSDARGRALVGVWVLSMALYFGRPMLGPLLKLLPGSENLFLHRYIMGVHLAGVLLAGVGAQWLGYRVYLAVARVVEIISTRASRSVGAGHLVRPSRPGLALLPPAVAGATVVGLASLLISPAWSQKVFNEGWVPGLKLQQEVQGALDGRDLDRLLDRVATLGGGRVFAGSTATWGKQYAIGNVPVYAMLGDRDVDGVGFTLRTASLMTDPEVRFDERNPAQYDLFNIRYLVLPADRPPSVRATLLGSAGRHRLWQVDTSGYLEVVDAVGPPIVADRRNVGRQSAAFLASSELSLKHYPTVAFDGTPAGATTLSPSPSRVDAAGSIQLESDSPAGGVFRGDVVANRQAVVVLKSGYDPRWEVTVDGVAVPIEMMAPALPGVTVAPGRHVVVFRYVPYPYYPLLLAIGLLTLVLLHFGPRLIMKRAARSQRT